MIKNPGQVFKGFPPSVLQYFGQLDTEVNDTAGSVSELLATVAELSLAVNAMESAISALDAAVDSLLPLIDEVASLNQNIRLLNIPLDAIIEGVTPLCVGALQLPIGNYAAPIAFLGCALPGDAAYLRIARSSDNETMSLIGGGIGEPRWQSAGGGFSLLVATDVEIYLYGGSATTLSLVKNLHLSITS